jgi:hypothetical protein
VNEAGEGAVEPEIQQAVPFAIRPASVRSDTRTLAAERVNGEGRGSELSLQKIQGGIVLFGNWNTAAMMLLLAYYSWCLIVAASDQSGGLPRCSGRNPARL